MIVLHVIQSLDPRTGGPAQALKGLATGEQNTGAEVVVAATHFEDIDLAIVDSLKEKGVEVHLVGPCHGRLHRHRDLASTLAPLVDRAEIVHIHALWEEIQHRTARLAFAARTPYVIRPCGMLDPWSLNESRWAKRAYMALRLRRNLDRAAGIHYTTETERQLVEPMKLAAVPIVEPNGVDVGEFRELPEPGGLRKRFPAIGDRRITLFFSRLHHKKGLDLLIPAFARAKTEDDVLVIAGPDDGFADGVERLVREEKLGDQGLIVGMIEGRARFEALRDADLMVLPSYSENFGNVVLEAMAAGTAVIVSDQVNIHQEVTRAQAGAVVKTNVDELTVALRHWLASPEKRSEAGIRARRFAMERYDWDNIGARWLDHYERLRADAHAAAKREGSR